jgi:PHD and RING finger domain-containing protein 1
MSRRRKTQVNAWSVRTADGDFTAHGSRRRQCNSYCESVEMAEGTSSGAPVAASTRGNCEEGAASSTSVPSAATGGVGSTGPEPVKCPICLRKFTKQKLGTPDSCNHTFCALCIKKWSKNSNTCPVDRGVYDTILVRANLGGEVVRRISVKSVSQQVAEVWELMESCEACGEISDTEDGLLFCDFCCKGYHLQCANPPLVTSPRRMEFWFCSDCLALTDDSPEGRILHYCCQLSH